jgi:hypothetical protein
MECGQRVWNGVECVLSPFLGSFPTDLNCLLLHLEGALMYGKNAHIVRAFVDCKTCIAVPTAQFFEGRNTNAVLCHFCGVSKERVAV